MVCVYRGATGDGTRLSFTIQARMRTDAKTGEPSRFDAGGERGQVQ